MIVEELKTNAISTGIMAPMTEMEHEQVLFCQDKSTGLKAIIAIHNTVLGPALGGTRMWPYKSEEDALIDVLRLSRGMTYKNSISGLNLGGGKAVIIGDSRTQKTEAMFRRFGQFINDLGGKYYTAEDVGTSLKDMEYIHMSTNYIAGLPEFMGGSGNPSPVTAYGVYMGIKASAKKLYGNDSLAGKKVVVQGCGNVGQTLVSYIEKEGAEIYITDIYEDKVQETASKYKVQVVDSNNFYDMDMDIYAPCALGATINDETIPRLKCAIVAGAANNQLKVEDVHAQALKDKGILYAPDFVINAGGVINVYSEYIGNYNKERAMGLATNIYDTTLNIYALAEEKGITTLQAAKKLAEKRIEDMANLKKPLYIHR